MRRWVVTILIFSLCLSGLYGFFLYRYLKPEMLRTEIVASLEELTQGELSFDEFQLTYFPKVRADFSQVRLRSQDDALNLEAERLSVNLVPPLLLIGLRQASRVEVTGGSLVYDLPVEDVDPFTLKDLSFTLTPCGFKTPMNVGMTGTLGEGVGKVDLQGSVSIEEARISGFQNLGADLVLGFHEVSLGEAGKVIPSISPVRLSGGSVSGSVNFRKRAGEPLLHLQADTSFNQLVYELPSEKPSAPSPAIDGTFRFGVIWDSEREQLQIDRSELTSPVGTLMVNGSLLHRTREIEEIRATASGIILENLPQYLIGFREAIPFNIGFSGTSDLELSFSGALDHLTIHANWDLTGALLTYARYFSKPKDLPLNVTFGYLLQDGKKLAGDFSVRLKGMNMKGTLSGFDLKSGEGQMNVLTNKFPLAGWEELLPPLQPYRLAGESKILLNLDGDLRKLHTAETTMNLSLDHADITDAEDRGVRNVRMHLDYGGVGLDIKDTVFEIDGDPLELDLRVFGLGQAPTTTAQVRSAGFKPRAVLEVAEAFSQYWLPEEAKRGMATAGSWMRYLWGDDDDVQDMALKFTLNQEKLTLEDLTAQVYGGQIKVRGEFEVEGENPAYLGQVAVDRLNMARFWKQREEGQRVLDGSLFLKGDFWGTSSVGLDWRESMNAEGSVLMTNGEFHSFDLLAAVATVPGFQGVDPSETRSTPFDDLTTPFAIRSGKISAENLTMISGDMATEGSGEILMDGNLNFRLGVSVRSGLVQGLDQDSGMRKYVGPVPLLLSGPPGGPDLKPDIKRVSGLFEKLLKEDSHQVLRNFPREEDFRGL